MKYASAMKYGGELVAAVDCDYNSFKELVPLCPNCKEPVYLRIGGQRESVKGKAYQIAPHWCHFKGISAEQVAGCELRVNGYTEKDRAKIAAQARGQRLKLLQRWFWKIVISKLSEGIIGGSTVEFELEQAVTELKRIYFLIPATNHAVLDIQQKICSSSLEDVHTLSALMVDKFLEDAQDCSLDHVNEWADLVRKHEKRLHVGVCSEVINFLRAKQNRDSLLVDVLVLSVVASFFDYWQDYPGDAAIIEKLHKFTSDDCLWNFLSIIASIPWVSEFQRLEAEAKQRKDAA